MAEVEATVDPYAGLVYLDIFLRVNRPLAL